MKTGLCLIFHLYGFEQFGHLDVHTLMISNNEKYSFEKIPVNRSHNMSFYGFNHDLVNGSVPTRKLLAGINGPESVGPRTKLC